MKNHIFRNRLIAYIIDFTILSVLISLTLLLFKSNAQQINELEIKISDLSELVLTKNISLLTYLNEYANLLFKYDKLQILTNVLNLIYIIILFIIIPYYTKGQTIGKKLLKIKMVKIDGSKLSFLNLFLRSLIINFLGYLIITLLLINFVGAKIYFIMVIILGLLEFSLVIISGFMVLYNKERRGIHDILTKTKVEKMIRVIK